MTEKTLTEREVLAAARSIRELEALRVLQSAPNPARIALTGQYAGISDVPLEAVELQAVIAFLIERHTTFVASLGITPAEPAK